MPITANPAPSVAGREGVCSGAMAVDPERDRQEKAEIARQSNEHERVQRERETDILLAKQALSRELEERIRQERTAAKQEREEMDRQLRRRS